MSDILLDEISSAVEIANDDYPVTVQGDVSVTSITDTQVNIVSVGEQGPPGPPGQGYSLRDDTSPTLGGDLVLNGFGIRGGLEQEFLVVDGGLL